MYIQNTCMQCIGLHVCSLVPPSMDFNRVGSQVRQGIAHLRFIAKLYSLLLLNLSLYILLCSSDL